MILSERLTCHISLTKTFFFSFRDIYNNTIYLLFIQETAEEARKREIEEGVKILFSTEDRPEINSILDCFSRTESTHSTANVILDDSSVPKNVDAAQEQCVIDMDSDDGGDAMW